MLEANPKAHRDEWRADLQKIRSLGFNTVRTWIDWATAEPQRGVYRFEHLDQMLDLAQEQGLKVFVQVYMDSAPDWIGREHPDAMFVSSGGERIHPESSPGYCRDHPAMRALDNAFYKALAEHVGKHPAFAGFDLWSEPHVINWATPTYIENPEFCFCPNTLRRYRAWLKKKYGTLDALNAAWYRRFESWEQVEPNRLSTILSYTDYIDWKTFIADKLGEDLKERSADVKAGAPNAWTTSHAAGVGLYSSPHWWEGQSDDWTMAASVDNYGTSMYPKHSANVDRDPVWRGALLDFTRSFGFGGGHSGFVIGEMQAGFGTIALNVSKPVTATDLRMWAWSALSRGARAIFYYAFYPMSTGYESGGYGLVEPDGTITERARAAGEVARVVDRNQALFSAAHPPKAEVAIIYNPLSHFVGGRQRDTAYGGPQGEVAGIERDSWLGVYEALWTKNVPIDYVHADHISAESLQQYKLVILPYAPMLSDRAAEALKGYVEQGGSLYAEARTAWNNERGRAAAIVPGAGLDAVFGAREDSVESAHAEELKITFTDATAPLPGRWFKERMRTTREDVRVRGRWADGTIAITESRYGRGQAIFAGSYLAAAFHTTHDESLRGFFLNLPGWAGVRIPVGVDASGVETRWLESGDRQIVFLFNHGDERANPKLRSDGYNRFEDLLDGSKGSRAEPLPVAAHNLRVLLLVR
jgi:beta-galactosidase